MNNYHFKRIFIIVADSMGAGYMEDAKDYGDEGANTLLHLSEKMPNGLNVPTLNKLGLGDLDPIKGTSKVKHPFSFILKANAVSKGKDTMTGHWEMMGIHTKNPFKTFTDTGFPKKLIKQLEQKTGYKIIGNKAASGTDILVELGEQQVRDNCLIVYTSSDSVLQIAAHEEVTGLKELYRVCAIAREICMKPEWKVGRVIARPFIGTNKDNFKRVTGHRLDLALKPDSPTVLNVLQDHGFMTSGIGKIGDIFGQYGLVQSQTTVSNEDGMDKTIQEITKHDFTGLCFINLVEFDSEYGHRRDAIGYGRCIERFDLRVAQLLPLLKDDDLLIITADHGNDPTWVGSDHTREKIPIIIYNTNFSNGSCLAERKSFADLGATVLKNFNLEKPNHLLGLPIEEIFN
ncbi:MAG: phosphopentomutase [Erysipelotrichia bacterium]|nr:phosphopentomutase [Erysipelotrichia bacterium]